MVSDPTPFGEQLERDIALLMPALVCVSTLFRKFDDVSGQVELLGTGDPPNVGARHVVPLPRLQTGY